MYVAVFGLGIFQETGIKLLKKLNYKIIGFDEFHSPFLKELVDKFFCISFKDKKKILKICKNYKVKYLFAFSIDAPLRTISYINSSLKLKGYKPKDVNLILNKVEFRLFLKEKMKINKPNFFSIDSNKKINSKIHEKIKFPIVCKPNYGSGSIGVFFTKDFGEFKKRYFENKIYYKNKKILMEEFIPGIEYAVEGWIYNSKFVLGCISKKMRTDPPYLIDKNVIFNYKNNSIKKKILFFFKKFITLSKINNVPIHFEFIPIRNKIVPIDIAIRGAGCGIYSDILSKIMNQSTDLILINLMKKKKIKFNKPNNKIYYLNFLYSNKKGIFKGLKDIEKLKKNNSFLNLKFYKKINSIISPLKKGSDRIGHYLLMNSPNKIKKDIRYLKHNVKMNISYE